MGDLLKSTYTNIANSVTDTVICTGASVTSTVISLLVCNIEASTDATFTLTVVDNSNSNTVSIIYEDQSLPAKATFEHTSKITLMPSDTLKLQLGVSDQSANIVCSYLEQT
tara:strand:- start:591 stop:923 length:333 start_codon:yes stop_codon:yes gene_type:complete